MANYLIEGLAVMGLVISLCVAVVCWRQYQQLKHIRGKYALDIERLEKSFLRLNDVSLGMGQRMLQMEQKISTPVKAPVARVEPTEAAGYSQAVHLLNKGLEATEVAAACGISHTEAQLMALIRAKKSAYDALRD